MPTKIKWDGSFEELKTFVATLGFRGEWSSEGNGKEVFTTRSNGLLNYWPSTGTVTFQTFQGKGSERFKQAYEEASAGNSEIVLASAEKKVFVVYGHDDDARRDLELFLRRLKLDPFVMQNDAKASEVIIEVLEQKIPEHSFGIALLTPDDFGYSKSENDESRQPRARQNVVLELGMLLGKLGRPKVAILVKGNVERPSDLGGVLYINYNKSIRENAMRLITKLRESGIEINDNDMQLALSD